MTEARSFAECLFARAGDAAIIDAASGQRHAVAEVPALAAGFLAAGLAPGQVVVLVVDVTAEAVLAYLAALQAGLVPLPVHRSDLVRYTPDELARVPGVTGCWAAAASQLEAFPAGLVRLSGLEPAGGATPSPRRGTETAVLMMTSGSTGRPDVVAVSSDNLLCNTRAIVRSQRLGEGERAMLVLPTSYCFGTSVVHSHLWVGGDVVVDRRFVFPEKVVAALAEFGCTSFAGVPTAYRTLAQRTGIGLTPLPALRRFLQAGGALDAATIADIRGRVPHADFFVMYGQTEATSRITTLPPEDLDRKPGSAGLPVDGVEIAIVDDDGRPLGPGQSGEIVVRGASVARPLLTGSAKFRDGALHTGDIGRRDAEGYLYVEGRRSHFLKCRGVRIGFGEIERLVQQVPGVAAALAFPVPDGDSGEAIGLAVVPQDGCGGEALRAAVKRSLPRPWTLGRLEFMAELPLTPAGKPDRSRLAAR